MRRPCRLNPPKASSQQGFALFIVLIVMIVIALLVVAAVQAYNTEYRISANDSDRKYAMSISEAALRQGEQDIVDFETKAALTFKDNCEEGLCRAVGATNSNAGNTKITVDGNSTESAWKRTCTGEKLCMEENGRVYPKNAQPSDVQAHYIIEFVKTDKATGTSYYRVTAKAKGRNDNTTVITQSYVAAE
ncbi:pilus assembly PilX family protein [Neisseria chenwenguii]|uniref:Pilus assembly protein PilX n=1 Tax=Neisseria chenwenguii TaxID=1853278 RepID=A0A220S407_9NEIS|nr:pilus assembly protein [Neisseria chenwenguii]ASK28132.1 pilus assembly protein PilX [Neisseria chenwenguii]ROV57282.1 pilus assembly protein [Neisseria chenwenguii]